MRGILTQSIGQHATRRSGTDDDVVIVTHARSIYTFSYLMNDAPSRWRATCSGIVIPKCEAIEG